MQETQAQSLGWKGPLEKGMATHSSILAWRIPWTEKPGGLHSTGSQELDTTEKLILLLLLMSFFKTTELLMDFSQFHTSCEK